MVLFKTLVNEVYNKDKPFAMISLRMITDWDLREKHPIMILNELGAEFHFRDLCQLGLPHKPTFGVAVTVSNFYFVYILKVHRHC